MSQQAHTTAISPRGISQQAHTISLERNEQRDPSQKEPVKMFPPIGTDIQKYILQFVKSFDESPPKNWKHWTDLSKCFVKNLLLSERYLTKVDLSGSSLIDCEFSLIYFYECDFSHTHNFSKFSRCRFYNCTFNEGSTILLNKSCEFINPIIIEDIYNGEYDDQEYFTLPKYDYRGGTTITQILVEKY
jgi:hypothetical protein